MREPTHIGDFLKDIISSTDEGTEQAAKETNLPVAYLDVIMDKQCRITPETAVKLAKLAGTPRLWLSLQTGHELWSIENE